MQQIQSIAVHAALDGHSSQMKQEASGGSQEVDQEGTWLLITSPVGHTLGYVRLDDHDHELNLSEIRDMIHLKLASQAEYQHGWTFGSGWPLKIVERKRESQVLAKSVLPSITVLSQHSAQILSQSADQIIAATAMQYGITPATSNMNGGLNSNLNNISMAFPQSGNTAMFAPVNSVNVMAPTMSGNPQSSLSNLLQPPMSGESDQSQLSGSNPPLPMFSPPSLSQQQIAEKAQAQRKKLQNLLPGKQPAKRWLSSMTNAAPQNVINGGASRKRTESPRSRISESPSKRRTKKPMVPRLKEMDSAGNVIDPVPPIPRIVDPKQAPTMAMQRDLYCNQCQKVFETDRGYKQHMNKQHGIKLTRGRNKERRFECEHPGCDRAFYQRSDLRRHQRVHLGVKPFKCSVCFKEFTQRGSLYRHIKGTHKGKDHKKLVLLQTEDTLPKHPRRRSETMSPTNEQEADDGALDNDTSSDLPPALNNNVNSNNGIPMDSAICEFAGSLSLGDMPPAMESLNGKDGKEEAKLTESVADEGVPPPLIKMKAMDNAYVETTDNRPSPMQTAEWEDIEMKEERS